MVLAACRFHNGDMRAIIGALVLIGGGVLATAFVMSVAAGNGSETEWILLGPMPFWVIGLIGYLRQPRHRVVWWLVGISVLFSCDVALGDLFLPAATAGQLARRRLEHAADRWILGARRLREPQPLRREPDPDAGIG
jgi:hypothetical protein